ncbi:alanine/ornithine racemase family PLP-dependent enzyme [Porifericola rhodea]|uniref:alanine/ornithine racemase family PLP-dependent enzyme n=1 Tax=Porifericola rhodea TaxID=930972 RepID=UPI0026654F7F|nr:alanine/ornithine racemase family PLP-dependent enzyme [Porifericola rhodea]WKN30679.1 alanine/ornithine racemase family PLP-dependent enzyme [Porifericola rhodea]
MAYIKMKRESLKHNYDFLQDLFQSNNLHWGAVSKLMCGNELFLKELIDLGVREVHDSRISNLKKIKDINTEVQTVYIKPPAKEAVEDIISYADVSMNTEYYTLKLLSDEAVKQDKLHKAIIMIETGDLREGVMGEHLIDFYSKVFELPKIEIIGIGTNLNCLHGVMPSQDKLIQLSLYKQIIELKFNRKIPWVSGGTSVTIPLIINKQIPQGVNHFRVGETLYFGANLFEDKLIPGMKDDVFEFGAQIIEITEKPMLPIGELGANPQGDVMEVDSALYGKTHYRAILDVGLLDLDPKYIMPMEDDYEVVGASSDMLVLDLEKNKANLKVGDVLRFRLKYMGALQLLNSDYIEKRIE